jgi:predicted AlkP superfamily pyrophosphatase or phosphodiesterase
MVTACYFWPGSEAAIDGVRPTLWKPYSAEVSNAERVQTALEWLRMAPERRPHVLTLYFSELDSISHRTTLDSPGIEQAARSLDASLGMLLDGLEAMPVGNQVYVILTSDHGMVETGTSQTIRLASLIDVSGIEPAFGGPLASLHVSGNRAREVRDAINARLKQGRAYLRQELPERHHYRADPRAGDVVVVMNEGWTLATSDRSNGQNVRWGAHGWDPAFASMAAMFVVTGPGLRAGTTIGDVRNIDVYPFMTELLGLRPASGIDGRAGAIRQQTATRTR